MKTVEIFLAIINGLTDSLAKTLSRVLDYILKKLTDCFDLENNYIKYWSFLLSLVIFFFCFCVYKTCTTSNLTTHCTIEYSLDRRSFGLEGVRQWMRNNNNFGRYQTFEEALSKAKTINCPIK